MNDALRDFPDRLARTIEGLSDDELQRPESAGKWSVAQVIAHLAQFEMIVALRVRNILAGDTPSLFAFDQERWNRDVYRGEPAAELLEQLRFLRGMNLKLLERLSPAEWDRAGIHPQYGHNTIRQLIARFEKHQEKHLKQIERIKNGRQ